MADPYKNNVVLYLPMEGSRDGDVAILDKTGKTVTRKGDTHLSTDVVPPFGTTSAYFDGTGDYLTLADSSAFDLAALDFTIEAWLYINAAPGTTAGFVGKQRGAASFGEYAFYINTSRQIGFAATTGGESASSWTLVSVVGTANVVPTGTWTHIAVCRRGTQFTLWVGGVPAGSATASGAVTDFTSSLSVGSLKDSGEFPLTGYLKDLRITKGVARYTGNFYVDQKPFAWDEPEQPRIML